MFNESVPQRAAERGDETFAEIHSEHSWERGAGYQAMREAATGSLHDVNRDASERSPAANDAAARPSPELKQVPKGDARPDRERFFEPGSLSLSRTEALNRCYVERKERRSDFNMCTVSDVYHITYFMLPKSGSSTGRHVMKDVKHGFSGKEISRPECNRKLRDSEFLNIVSVRNPLTRFFASYDEAFVRKLPSQHRIPLKYRKFMEPFQGWVYNDYAELFDDPAGVRLLTKSFETFVRDYDGEIVYDEHLQLQAPQLWDNSQDKMFQFDLAFDTKELDAKFHELAVRVNAPPPRVIRGRSYPRRFNTSALADVTYQKICRLAAIDFCCLNFPLPPACTLESVAKDERVMCKWVRRSDGQDYISHTLV